MLAIAKTSISSIILGSPLKCAIAGFNCTLSTDIHVCKEIDEAINIKCIRECVHFSLGSIRLSFASFHFVIRLWQLRLRRWSSGSISRPRYALVRFGGGRVSRPKAATTPTPANGNRWWQTEASGCRQRGGEKGRLWRLREKCALFLFWNHSFFFLFFF